MPIVRLLQNAAFDPTDIEIIAAAFEDACRELGLVERPDPLSELLARKFIEIAQNGERDPRRLRQKAIKRMNAEINSKAG